MMRKTRRKTINLIKNEIDPIDLTYLEKDLFDNNQLKVMPASFYKDIPQNDLSFFCWKHGFYSLPTIELCEWLKEKIAGRSAIEIGAGHGAVAKYLGIPATDSKLQADSAIQLAYTMQGQPTVKYPPHIIKLGGNEAVSTYKPEVVVACWVTQIYKESEHWRGGNMFGVDEDRLLDNVSCYIHVGHLKTHGNKRILNRSHEKFTFPWLYGRSMDKDNHIIYVWEL
jgi:hypothetical protein